MCLYKDGFLSYEGLGFVFIYICVYICIYEGLILSYEGFQWWRRRSWTYRWAEGDFGPTGGQKEEQFLSGLSCSRMASGFSSAQMASDIPCPTTAM